MSWARHVLCLPPSQPSFGIAERGLNVAFVGDAMEEPFERRTPNCVKSCCRIALLKEGVPMYSEYVVDSTDTQAVSGEDELSLRVMTKFHSLVHGLYHLRFALQLSRHELRWSGRHSQRQSSFCC